MRYLIALLLCLTCLTAYGEAKLYVYSNLDEAEYDYFEIVPHPKSNWVVANEGVYNTKSKEFWKLEKEDENENHGNITIPDKSNINLPR